MPAHDGVDTVVGQGVTVERDGVERGNRRGDAHVAQLIGGGVGDR